MTQAYHKHKSLVEKKAISGQSFKYWTDGYQDNHKFTVYINSKGLKKCQDDLDKDLFKKLKTVYTELSKNDAFKIALASIKQGAVSVILTTRDGTLEISQKIKEIGKNREAIFVTGDESYRKIWYAVYLPTIQK